MVSKSQTIQLVSKLNPDVFKFINKDVFGTTEQPLGSIHGAVNRIMSPEYESLLKSIMPTIISLSPNDQTWYKRVKNYWDSFGIKVPIGGKNLEIGFNFSIEDTMRKIAISELITKTSTKEGATIISDEALAIYVIKNIPEFEKYKYAMPINPEQYLIWLFCLGHRKVAKETGAIDKSLNIDFILIDPTVVEDNKRKEHTLSNDALRKYLEIIVDRSKVRDILYVRNINAAELEDIDADARLKQFVISSPKEFLAIATDNTTTTKARIERYCIRGVLKKLPNSSIIVDGNDNGVLIGNTIAEAVVYFNSESPDKAAKVAEFKTRYAQLTKK